MARTLSLPRVGRRVGPARGAALAVALLVLLAAVGYVAYTRLIAPSAPAVPPQIVPVRRDTIVSQVSSAGTAVSTRQARLSFSATGRVKEVRVQVGEAVSAGQALAALDTAQLELKLAQAQSNLRTAQLKYEQLKQGAAPEDVAAAEAAYQAALARLNDLQNGPAASDLAAAQAGVESARANLESARAKLAQLEAGPTQADLDAAHAAVVQAEASLATAQQRLADLRATPKPEDIRTAELAVEQARNSLWSTQISRDATCGREGKDSPQCKSANASVAAQETGVSQALARLEQAKQPASADEIRAAEEGVRSAQAALDSARAKEQQVIAGPTEADLQAARNAVTTAEANLAAAEAKLEQVQSVSPSDLAAAQSNVASSAAQLASRQRPASDTDLALAQEAVVLAEVAVRQAQLDLDNAVLRAPFAGVVTAVNINEGELPASGAAITLVDPRAIRVDLNVDEVDVTRLQAGQSAEVTFDALPGRRFPGKVVAVAPAGTATQGVVTYPVAVTIDPGDATIPAGMTASVTVQVSRQENVLVVPARAVYRQGRQQFVDVMAGDNVERREVRTGASNDQLVEVVSGLKEGEQVVVRATTTASPVIRGGTFGAQPVQPVRVPGR